MSVVLPAPFSPTSAWISPAQAPRDASWMARGWSNRFAMCVMLMTSPPASKAVPPVRMGRGRARPGPKSPGVRDRGRRRHRRLAHLLRSRLEVKVVGYDDVARDHLLSKLVDLFQHVVRNEALVLFVPGRGDAAFLEAVVEDPAAP